MGMRRVSTRGIHPAEHPWYRCLSNTKTEKGKETSHSHSSHHHDYPYLASIPIIVPWNSIWFNPVALSRQACWNVHCLQSTVASTGGRLALGHRLQSPATGLHALAVDARGALVAARALLAGIVDVDDVEGVDVTGDVSVRKSKYSFSKKKKSPEEESMFDSWGTKTKKGRTGGRRTLAASNRC